jgi:lipoic acid synthetase
VILYEWKVGASMLYINTSKNEDWSCAFYFGLEEYLVKEWKQEEPVFLLWRVKPTVMIGRHQITEAEVDRSYLDSIEISLVRRNSGGGAVYTDSGCFQFSFITSAKEHENLPESSVKNIVSAIAKLGVDIQFSGRNDLLVDGRKCSGIAEYIHNDRMVIHGTILFDTNLHHLVSSLTPHPKKLASKAIDSVRSRVMNLSEILDMSIEEFEQSLIDSVSEREIMLDELDLERVKLYASKFKTDEWNIGKNPRFTFSNTLKFPSGLYSVHALVNGNLIKKLSVKGDFFTLNDLSEFEEAFVGVPFTREAFIEVTNKHHVRDYFVNLKRTEFLELFFGKKKITRKRKPSTIRINLKDMNERFKEVRSILAQRGLHTVCEEASCPNQLECFSHKTATFMILGNRCTRNCAFCDVTQGRPLAVDPNEADQIVSAVKVMGLKYVVITSVTRDDLRNDYGSSHFAHVIQTIRKKVPDVYIEVLIPDFLGHLPALEKVVKAKPDVINHNIETIQRLYPGFRDRADYTRSLEVLKRVKQLDPSIKTKSGIMVGIGETEEEVVSAMKDLRDVGCDFLTIGQYLQPSEQHTPVLEYVSEEQFAKYKKIGMKLGFGHVASGAMVRSSYQAHKQFQGDGHETNSTV